MPHRHAVYRVLAQPGHREPQEEMAARYGQRQAEAVSRLLGCQAKRTADGNEVVPPLVVWGGGP